MLFYLTNKIIKEKEPCGQANTPSTKGSSCPVEITTDRDTRPVQVETIAYNAAAPRRHQTAQSLG